MKISRASYTASCTFQTFEKWTLENRPRLVEIDVKKMKKKSQDERTSNLEKVFESIFNTALVK